MSLIAINLLPCLMQKAAFEAQKPLAELSFKGTLDLVTSSHESFRNHAGKAQAAAKARVKLLEILATKLLQIRPNRSEPRAVKRRPKNYQRLTKPRHEFEETPHRSNYRNPA